MEVKPSPRSPSPFHSNVMRRIAFIFFHSAEVRYETREDKAVMSTEDHDGLRVII